MLLSLRLLLCGRRLLRLCRLSLYCLRLGRSGLCRRACSADYGHHAVHLNRGAFFHFDFAQHTSGRRGDFGVNFVSGDFKQRLVALDLVANFLQPLGNSALKNRFAHLRHHHIHTCAAIGSSRSRAFFLLYRR